MGEDEPIREFQIETSINMGPTSHGLLGSRAWIHVSSIASIADISGRMHSAFINCHGDMNYAVRCDDIVELIQWWRQNATIGLVTPA
jgi:hypothetical protein